MGWKPVQVRDGGSNKVSSPKVDDENEEDADIEEAEYGGLKEESIPYLKEGDSMVGRQVSYVGLEAEDKRGGRANG